MSIRSLYEIVIYFNTFRNIDLRNQGLYRIQICLYYLSKDKKIKYYAHPLYFNKTEITGINSNIKHKVTEPQIISDYYYCTKGFLIKYLDEDVQLNEFIKFRIENDIFDPISSELYFETTLLMVDLVNCREIEYGYLSQAQLDALEFISLSQRIFIINYSTKPFIFQFLPIIFNDFNYAECDTLLYIRLSDFKLRKIQLSKSEIDENVHIVHLVNQKITHKNFVDNKILQLEITDYIYEKITNPETNKVNNEMLSNLHYIMINSLLKTFGNMEKLYNELKKLFKHEGFSELIDKNISGKKFNDIEFKGNHQSMIEVINKNFNANTNPNQENIYSDISVKPKRIQSESGKEISKFPEQFESSKHLKDDDDAFEVCNDFVLQMNYFISDGLTLSEKITKFIFDYLNAISFYYHTMFNDLYYKEFEHFVISHNENENEFFSQKPRHQRKTHITEANKLRIILSQNSINSMNIIDSHIFSDVTEIPLIFEEKVKWNHIDNHSSPKIMLSSFQIFKIKGEVKQNLQNSQLIILVHGYKGSSFDLRLIKNNLSLIYPDYHFLCSNSNEKKTENDINILGNNLAMEVINYIKDNCLNKIIKKIHFIGYSMGGLIIRNALPQLEEYKDKFGTLVTLATTHLGLMFSASTLTNTGIWFIQQWNNEISLRQISMEEVKNRRESLLYKMSKYKGLEWFQNILLMASGNDNYCPYESGVIDICTDIMKSKERKPIYLEMLENLRTKMQFKNVIRADVNFNIKKTNIDKIIGRASHIQFLDNEKFSRLFAYKYANLFT